MPRLEPPATSTECNLRHEETDLTYTASMTPAHLLKPVLIAGEN